MTASLPPRVLVVISHLAVGGAENVAIALAESAAESAHFTFFTVLAGTPDPQVAEVLRRRLTAVGVSIRCGTHLPFKRGGVLAAAWQLRRLILDEQPNVVHVHTEIPELTLAIALLGLRARWSMQVLRTVHNTVLWSGWGMIGRWVMRRLSLAAVAGVSEAALAADAELRRQAGLPPAPDVRRALIYNGVSPPNRRRALLNDSGPHVRLKLLFAGRFEPQKGVDLLPTILRKAATCAPGRAEVTFVGSGSLRAAIQANLESEPLAWPVNFIDALPNLGAHLGDYDLVLMPSRFEGLPLVAVEAGLAGVPVVAFAAPGLSEVVPTMDPLSAPLEDVDAFSERIIAFVENPNRFRREAQVRMLEMGERFCLTSMSRRYLQIYECGRTP